MLLIKLVSISDASTQTIRNLPETTVSQNSALDDMIHARGRAASLTDRDRELPLAGWADDVLAAWRAGRAILLRQYVTTTIEVMVSWAPAQKGDAAHDRT